MADDDLDEDFDPEAEDEVDEDAIVEDIDAEDEVLDEDDSLADDDVAVVVVDDEEEDEEEAAEPAARAKKRAAVAEDDEDEDELDPDDVEADLDTILKDRIAAADEEEDEDELEEAAPRTVAEAPDGVIPKKANEFVCTGCFLLVNRGQFGPENDMQCPVGESECPAIDVLQGTGTAPPAAKAARKR